MDKNIAKKIIEDNKLNSFLTGGVDESKIQEIEKSLNATLPESYTWFLNEYGEGIICGIEILGAGAKEAVIPSVVRITEKCRNEDNLPTQYVVVEEVGEYSYCIDTSILKNNESPIIEWDPIKEKVNKQVYNNFYEYLYERISEMMD